MEQKDTNKTSGLEEIVQLDNEAVQNVLREVETTSLAIALKAVGPEVQEKIFKNMSERAVDLLKKDMDAMGPVRLADAEAEQQKIVDIINKQKENN